MIMSYYNNINILLFTLIFWILFIIFAIKFIKWLFNNLFSSNKSDEIIDSPPLSKLYDKKAFMTKCEYDFYLKLLDLESEYRVIPQINLATIIKKTSGKYINELFKNIDFAIFDKDFKNVLLLIELNDSSHNANNRKSRDLKVKKICEEAGIKLITFYTNYPNEKNYVINRIKKNIN